MKILLTGICGFVGSEIARQIRVLCADDRVQLVGIDNLSRSGSWRNREQLQSLGIAVIHGDLRNHSDLESIGPLDWVVDAAANPSVLAGVSGGQQSSRQLMEHNLLGTINLLEFCAKHRAGFTLLSTSRVYSIPPLASLKVEHRNQAFRPVAELPPGMTADGIQEEFSTSAPVSLYGATKLTSEQLALEYGMAFDFPVWVNRCGVMAGAGQFGKADQGIFAYWVHSWKEKRPLRYIGFGGNGYQVRDCLHPRDLAPLLLQQCRTPNDDRPRTVNVSGGISSARSLAQLSQWCTDRWGPHVIDRDTSERPFDLPWVVLDHSLATTHWDWQPRSNVDEILTEIADFADTQSSWIEFSS